MWWWKQIKKAFMEGYHKVIIKTNNVDGFGTSINKNALEQPDGIPVFMHSNENIIGRTTKFEMTNDGILWDFDLIKSMDKKDLDHLFLVLAGVCNPEDIELVDGKRIIKKMSLLHVSLFLEPPVITLIDEDKK